MFCQQTAIRRSSHSIISLVSRNFHILPRRIPQSTSPFVFCTCPRQRILQQLRSHRTFSSSSQSRGDVSSSSTADTQILKADVPSYEMTFTCKKCGARSTHRLSKQGYHKGTVLITCPGCKNRHLIADHLKIFSDTSVTLEDLLKAKGQLVKRGTLGTDGDVEFWDDGAETVRQSMPNETPKSLE